MNKCRMIHSRTVNFHHIWSCYSPGDGKTAQRMKLAQQTWAQQPWQEMPVLDSALPRLFRDAGGAVPYIKDLIELGGAFASPVDILIFTNADICVSLRCCDQLAEMLQTRNALYGHRFDFKRLDEPLPDDKIHTGSYYCGMDLFAFRKAWWMENARHMPDMLIGRQAWDSVMQYLIMGTHPNLDCDCCGVCYHEKHPSVWEDAKNIRSLPSQVHNITLAREWFAKHGINAAEAGLR